MSAEAVRELTVAGGHLPVPDRGPVVLPGLVPEQLGRVRVGTCAKVRASSRVPVQGGRGVDQAEGYSPWRPRRPAAGPHGHEPPPVRRGRTASRPRSDPARSAACAAAPASAARPAACADRRRRPAPPPAPRLRPGREDRAPDRPAAGARRASSHRCRSLAAAASRQPEDDGQRFPPHVPAACAPWKISYSSPSRCSRPASDQGSGPHPDRGHRPAPPSPRPGDQADGGRVRDEPLLGIPQQAVHASRVPFGPGASGRRPPNQAVESGRPRNYVNGPSRPVAGGFRAAPSEPVADAG